MSQFWNTILSQQKELDAAYQRGYEEGVKAERERVQEEFKWMKPMCFGRHEAICDTRCSWTIRERCIESLRATPKKQERDP